MVELKIFQGSMERIYMRASIKMSKEDTEWKKRFEFEAWIGEFDEENLKMIGITEQQGFEN